MRGPTTKTLEVSAVSLLVYRGIPHVFGATTAMLAWSRFPYPFHALRG